MLDHVYLTSTHVPAYKRQMFYPVGSSKMKVLVAITLLIGVVSLISGVAAVKRTSCSPGETWKESCHTCICDGEGRPMCTRELCRGQGIKMVLPPIREKREATECEPGTTWKEDCNTCYCTPNGVKGCTRRECVSAYHLENNN